MIDDDRNDDIRMVSHWKLGPPVVFWNRVVSNLGPGAQLTRSFQTGGGARGGESSATSNRHSSDSRQVEPRKLLQKVETVDTDIRETKDCSRGKS